LNTTKSCQTVVIEQKLPLSFSVKLFCFVFKVSFFSQVFRLVSYVLSISYSMRRNFRPTSKFSLNLIVYLLFFIFCCVKKKKESLWNIFFLITQPFLYLEGLEGALKLISQEQFKNTTTKIFQVRQQFRGSTCIEYDMEST